MSRAVPSPKAVRACPKSPGVLVVAARAYVRGEAEVEAAHPEIRQECTHE